jgi:hypothetical protein
MLISLLGILKERPTPLKTLAADAASVLGISLEYAPPNSRSDFVDGLSGKAGPFELSYHKVLPEPQQLNLEEEPTDPDVAEILGHDALRRQVALDLRSKATEGSLNADDVIAVWENGPYQEAIHLSKDGPDGVEETVMILEARREIGGQETVWVHMRLREPGQRCALTKRLSEIEKPVGFAARARESLLSDVSSARTTLRWAVDSLPDPGEFAEFVEKAIRQA